MWAIIIIIIRLTTGVGDERPCQRCIKRGLQDACHDGVRKKAKYLHDAPSESLLPGMGLRGASSRFQYIPNLPRGPPLGHEAVYPISSAGGAYALPLAVPTTFSMYATGAPPGSMPMPLPMVDPVMSPSAYRGPVTPISPQFPPGSRHQTSSMPHMAGVMRSNPPNTPNPLESPYHAHIVDPHDPTQYHYDPTSFHFGTLYGALEFGMLDPMASGVGETSGDASGPLSAPGAGYTTPGGMSSVYDGSPVHASTYFYSPDPNFSEWRPDGALVASQSSGPPTFPLTAPPQMPMTEMMPQDFLHGYPIGTSPSSLTSSSSSSSPANAMVGMDDGLHSASMYASNVAPPNPHDGSVSQESTSSVMSTPNLPSQMSPTRRTRDASSIYDHGKQPYSSATGFHGLTAFLQQRFSPPKTLRIANALASIRPSFLPCAKTLNREDLIFMEKSFQRTLFDYEEFINACGTPTIVCRRTGEVAAVGKEFSMLTGWKKEILLGNEPNRNVNTGHAVATSSLRGGTNPPRGPGGTASEAIDESRPRPVFLAELLDDDSVVGFYEDFARLAFGDSRGSVTRQCHLLKYQTAADHAAEADPTRNEMGAPLGTQPLGDRDSKVECSYCWTVKRDMFEIPMLIVMNVSDCTPTTLTLTRLGSVLGLMSLR